MTLNEVQAALLKIRHLNEAPDKNGEIVVESDVIDAAEQLIPLLDVMPVVYPSSEGTVVFEYDRDDGTTITVETCRQSGCIGYKVKDNETEIIFFMNKPEELCRILNRNYLIHAKKEQHYL